MQQLMRKNETKCPDFTPPDDMEEGEGDEKYDKNKRNDQEKEGACPDVSPPHYIEEGEGDEKDDKNEKQEKEK